MATVSADHIESTKVIARPGTGEKKGSSVGTGDVPRLNGYDIQVGDGLNSISS